MASEWMIAILVVMLAQAPAEPENKPADAAPAAATAPTTSASETMDLTLSGNEVAVETVGDTVILKGTEADIAALERMLRILDQAAAPPKIEFFRLQNGRAQEIAPTLQRQLQDVLSKTGRQKDFVSIQADTRTNTLMVAGSESVMELARRFIEMLDAEGSLTDISIETFTLKHLPPSQLKAKIEEVLQQFQQMRGDTGPLPYNIEADDRLNQLRIYIQGARRPGVEADLKTISELISRLDVEPSELSKVKMVVLQLRRAKASELAETLREMIATAEGQATINEQISRLRVLQRNQETGELAPLPELDVEKPLRIIASEGAEALIVGTVEENLPAVTAIVELLDMVPVADEMSIRIFPLKHADAEATANLFNEIFEKGKDLPAQPGPGGDTGAVPDGVLGKALVYNVGIHADTQTNTLVVSGRLEQVLLAQQLINDLDVPGAAKFPFRLVVLKNVSATRVQTMLAEMIEQRVTSLQNRGLGQTAVENERVYLSVDKRSNGLIVAARPENYEEILEIITRLDNAPDGLPDQIRVLTLEKSSAIDLAARVAELFADRAAGEEDPEDVPVIIADARSNSLIMRSSQQDFDAVKSVVAKLEALEMSPLSDFRLVKLNHTDAAEIATTMEELFAERAQMRLAKEQEELPSDKVAIGVDAATNSLIVVASPENFESLVRLTTELDVELEAEGLVQSFQLINANAVDIADRIKDLWDQGIYRPGMVSTDTQEDRNKIAIVADPRANSVVVSASRSNFSIVTQLIKTLDADPSTLRSQMRIFKLTFADPMKLADVLKQYFEGLREQSDDQNVFPLPTIIPDERSSSLIFAGTNDAMSRAQTLVAELDVERSDPAAELKIYALQHASGTKLAPMIREIFEKRAESEAEQNRIPFQVMSEEGTNSLIISASREDHITVDGMLRSLDRQSDFEQQTRIFPLAKAKAEDLAETLTELFESQRRGSGSGTGAGGTGGDTSGIAITPDQRTNSLIVWAAPSDLENISTIIDRLDKTDPKIELMVKIVNLKQTLAEDLADVLNDALGGMGGTRTGTRTGTRAGGTSGTGGATGSRLGEDAAVLISFDEIDEQGIEQRRTLLRQDLTIVPDVRTNSIMIVAPVDSVDMLESLIRKLDIAPLSLQLRIFPLMNANAEEMRDMLQELFRTEEGRDQDEEERQLTFGEGGLSFSSLAGAAALEGGRQELSFTVDTRTNSIIAAGTEQYLMLVADLIDELDSQSIEDRTSLVYAIKNTTAEDLSGALEEYFAAETDRYDRLEDQSALTQMIRREVTVIPSEETNSLLLNFDPRRESEVMRIVRELDRPPPQVMIQVLLAEISLDDRLELGVEWAVQDLYFTENQVGGMGPGKDFVVGTDVGATGSGLGGFSFTITGEDFNFLLRMLQTEGRLSVLSRPMIMVQDNQEASIEIADRVPFVRGVTVSDTGATQTQVEYENVGIILEVTPHINVDGFVNLEVRPEISNRTPSSITITEGLNAPIFTQRSADTVVTVKDGETIVIGGLIQQREEDSENKVPIAGDLPGLGPLFRATVKAKEKRELLIVLTPRIVRTPEDAREATQKIFDEHSIPPHVRENELWENLQVKPGEVQLAPDAADQIPLEPEDGPPANAEQFQPKPGAYGPALPGRLNRTEGGGSDQAQAPPLYDEYLRQRQ